jgi:hypothetical protein
MLSLRVDGNNYFDKSNIRFEQGSTSSYDYMYDTPKMLGSADAPQLYTTIESDLFNSLTQNVLPQIEGNETVKMSLTVGAAGIYTITASDIESFTDDVTITLIDLQEGVSQVLNNNAVYTFNANPSDNEARFLVKFAGSVGVGNQETYGINIFAYDKQAFVNMPLHVTGTIQIFDMIGKKLNEVTAVTGTLNRIPMNLPTGYYLVSVRSNLGTVNAKVFIK